MIKSFVLITAVLCTLNIKAQVYYTKSGNISFNSSKESVEKVEATNNVAACKLNTTSGDLDFVVLIKSFVFTSSLMQDHFNENYMESEKFPKSSFKGKITNLRDVNFAKNGIYKVTVSGTLTIHGQSKVITVDGEVAVIDGSINLVSHFEVLLADYKVDIPSAVADKISKEISLSVDCKLIALKK